MSAKLDLYMFETCPYCRRVLNAIEASGRTDVELHNIHKNAEDRGRGNGTGALPFYRRKAAV